MALIMLFAGTVPLWAQTTGSVRGTVTVQLTERPLSGARVLLIGTQLAGTADQNGNFEIRSVPMGTYTIRVIIIGYASMETTVNVSPGQPAVVNFTLNPAAISLDEIVVTGTGGAQEKKTIGNSVGTIQVGAQMETAPINRVVELLTARTPGLSLMNQSGQAGDSPNIRIRGAGSLNAGYAPVFYVDGVRIQAGRLESGSLDHGGTALDFINPNDIESIEVIKGPAAATLYGADAANGVIQIITKKGRRGTESVQWTASMEFGQSEWTKTIGSNTQYWRCTVSNQGSSSYPGCQDPTTVEWWGRDANGDPILNVGIPESDIIRDITVDGVPDGTFLLKDETLMRHPAALRKGNSSEFNISARGGTGRMGYFLSFGKTDEDGVFFNNFSNRVGGRANFDVNISETVDFAVQFSYTQTHLRQPLSNNASNSINRNAMRGRARAYDRDWEPGFRGFNPWLSNEYDSQTRTERMTIGMTGNWSPFEWFRNKLTLGLDRLDYRTTDINIIDTTGQEPWGSTAATGRISHELPNRHRWTVDYAGSVDFAISETLGSEFSAGMQLNSYKRHTHNSSGDGMVSNQLNLVSSAANDQGGESRSEQTSLGFYLQERIAWRDNVFVTGAVRIDDNSAFGSDFSLVVYPKASVAWMISDEAFYNVGFTDQLKLRFAWGQAGNAPGPFSADRTFSVGSGVEGDEFVNTLVMSSYGNPDLKAETGQEWEAGFDASLLDGRAGLEFTYYNQKTVDALISVSDPPSTGYTGSHLTNIGTISNSGIELLITGSPVFSRNFQWDLSLSYATNNNKLVSFNGARDEIVFGSFADVQRHREGYPMGAFWAVDVERDANGDVVLRDDGVVVTDPADGNPTVMSSCRWAPSDPDWVQADECDDIYIGPSRPTKEAAFTSTFTLFGNLRIFGQFDYRGGHYQWCAICSINSRSDRNTWDVNTGGSDLNPDVSLADVEALRSLQTISHISSAEFLKFRELSLTYTLPTSWGQFFRGSRWSFTLAGRNLFVWTAYEGRGDPEVQFNSGSSFSMLDYASTPQTRRLSASMRVTF
jgi:TonB-linked SusC/RagA family outer membrane protein